MKTLALAFAALLATSAALPVAAQTTPPRDTGNMAYPAPLPQGNVATTVAPASRDTGNMAYPAPLPQGTVGTSAAPATRDTGNMAYPAPAPQGTVGTTTVK